MTLEVSIEWLVEPADFKFSEQASFIANAVYKAIREQYPRAKARVRVLNIEWTHTLRESITIEPLTQ